MRRGRKLISFLAAALIAVMMVLPVSATETGNNASDAVNAARKGVLQINLVYVDQGGNSHVIQGGSGFLIGATNGAEYMITNTHVITMDSEVRAAATEYFGVDFSNPNNINLQIQVVVKRDVVINATIVNSSDNMDFAILKLEQPIYDRESLVIDDNDDNVVETMEVFALGFPAAIEFVEDTSFYTSEDVNITNGIVSKKATIDGIKYIRHSATMSDGNSGGPLVNRQGQVVGINTAGVDDTYFYSLQISELTSVLNALGITFRQAENSDVPPEPTTETDPTETIIPPEPTVPSVDKSNLSTQINLAQSLEGLDEYAEDGMIALDEAVAAGQGVMENAGATQSEVDAAAAAINSARENLIKKSGTNIALIIAVIAAVVVIIVVALIVVLATGNKKKKTVPEPQPFRPTPPVPPVTAPQNVPHQASHYANFGPSEGSGETSVLNQGSGETSVLGGGTAQISATLTRKKNGENIQINKQLFKIGKERIRVDYCIPDNNSISRVHAQIVFKNSAYYIVDMKSTNYTYVNGNKVIPEQEMKLNSGDKIRFADEEFEFRC